MQVDFYQLGGTPPERILPRIAERVLGEGGRLLVVAADEALGQRLDETLWTYKADSFLPHARAGGESDASQPILIGAAPDPVNNARHIALADGIWRDEALTFDRAFHLFDDEAAEAARAAWRALAGREGVERRFWRQEEAGWTQVA